MRRLWLILVWFVLLVLWSLPPGWFATANSDKPRLLLASVGTLATPTVFLLTAAVIFLIFAVTFKYRPHF